MQTEAFSTTPSRTSGEKPQRTLVLIKPDNFRFPTGRPGNVIDFFSRTGLFIVAIKVHRMSVAQAIQFYGPVRDVLRSKLGDMVWKSSATGGWKKNLASASPEVQQQLGVLLCRFMAITSSTTLCDFMSGRTPGEMPSRLPERPGTETSIALIDEGPDAVAKIATCSAPTDPSKAPPGFHPPRVRLPHFWSTRHTRVIPKRTPCGKSASSNPANNNSNASVEEVYGLGD